MIKTWEYWSDRKLGVRTDVQRVVGWVCVCSVWEFLSVISSVWYYFQLLHMFLIFEKFFCSYKKILCCLCMNSMNKVWFDLDLNAETGFLQLWNDFYWFLSKLIVYPSSLVGKLCAGFVFVRQSDTHSKFYKLRVYWLLCSWPFLPNKIKQLKN